MNKLKILYYISLDNDCGELYLDENKKPLEWVHCNDATWNSYLSFIPKYFGGKIVELKPKILDDDYDLLEEADCIESIWKVVKKYI